ncbi:MAG: cysteine desulfurase family protein [Clostridia bacterium]
MIYLDNSATTWVLPQVAETVNYYMTENFFNPSSAYTAAVNVEHDVNAARQRLATLFGATPEEIIYTSGGTESNNMAIFGSLHALRNKGEIICGATEHPSVYEVFKSLIQQGYTVKFAPVTESGELDLDAFRALLSDKTQFISLMHVNNETGAVNDIAYCKKLINENAKNAIFHVDGVQAFAKLPFSRVPCDFYSISGHKLHAPKGVGALFVRKGTKFLGGQIGGGQERDLRSGTTNVPGIMGLDKAISIYSENQAKIIADMNRIKTQLISRLLGMNDVIINSPLKNFSAPHIINTSFLGVRGEVLLHSLADSGICVSTGSACSTHKKGSRVLSSMGIDGERLLGAIRISICPYTTSDEIDIACDNIETIITKLRKYKRR